MKRWLFALLTFLPGGAFALQPDSGWWYNPAESGRGFNIEFQGDNIFVAAFIYDEAGRQIWYSGGGAIDNNSWSGQLTRFQNGQCLHCVYTSPDVLAMSGPFSIRFTSHETAQVEWEGVAVSLERFRFGFSGAIEDYLGEWVLASDQGPDVGAHIAYVLVDTIEGRRVAVGSRLFDEERVAIAFFESNDLVVAVEVSSTLMDFFVFPLEAGGFNNFYGRYWLDQQGQPLTGDGRIAVAARVSQSGSFGDDFAARLAAKNAAGKVARQLSKTLRVYRQNRAAAALDSR